MKILKHLLILAVGTWTVQADETAIPEAFRGETEASPIEIDYSDWSLILRKTVVGPKRRSGARARSVNSSKVAPTGSRISRRNKRDTRNEGNRIDFLTLSKEVNIRDLTKIRRSLESVPAEAPLKHWKKNEQLAYWLNLYNVTLVEQLAKEYPFRKLKKKKKAKDSVWTRKTLTVNGVELSLNDIQYQILPNKWDTSIFIYGLYQGYIGGPSIQKTAFTGKNVHDLLERSAREFVNSNRGMKAKGKTLRVAEFYKENASVFPDWDTDVKNHVALFTHRNMKADVEKTSKIKTLKTDYYTTDVYGGGRDIGTAQSNNRAALEFATITAGDTFGAGGEEGGQNSVDGQTSILDKVRDMSYRDTLNGRLPQSMREYIFEMRKEELKRQGDVRIEPVDNGDMEKEPNGNQ